MAQTGWTLTIAGMTCEHCATAVDRALTAVPGVVRSVTHYSKARADVVANSTLNAAALRDAVTAAGYRVVGATSKSASHVCRGACAVRRWRSRGRRPTATGFACRHHDRRAASDSFHHGSGRSLVSHQYGRARARSAAAVAARDRRRLHRLSWRSCALARASR